MAFTSLIPAARYGSNQGTGPHLPATVSRNTPAVETGAIMPRGFRAGKNGDEIYSDGFGPDTSPCAAAEI